MLQKNKIYVGIGTYLRHDSQRLDWNLLNKKSNAWFLYNIVYWIHFYLI